jgi:hypothetical protein
MKKFKLNPVLKLKLHGLLGILIVAPFMWELMAIGPTRDLPVKWRAIVLVALNVLAYIWFLQCRTADKTQVKPKWW